MTISNHTSTTLQKILLPLFLLFFGKTALGQTPTIQDCLGAIPICTEVYTETTAPSGAGNYANEINGTSQGGICCMDAELNSIWYTFTVNQSGDFGFVLTPNDLDDDYDWALFNITGQSCEDIFNDPSLQVSCNAAGGSNCHGATGADGGSVYDNQGAGCSFPTPNQFLGFSPFNALVPVLEGNTYVLVVSNWTGSPNGYEIDFGVSGNIGILDNQAPNVTDVVPPGDCGGSEIEVVFSENIQCSTITGNNFLISGPGGPYDALVTSATCSQGGEYDNQFTILVSPQITEAGTYTIELTNGGNEVLDLCGNPAVVTDFQFEILNSALASLDIGNDTILCEGEVLTINATTPNADTYEWQDGSNDPIYNITQSGTYDVSVTNTCNTLFDQINVDFVPLQTVEVDLGNDTMLCPEELYELDATWSGGIQYSWQDGFDQPIYTVAESGIYEVQILGACGEMGTAMIEVLYDETTLNVNLGADTVACEEDGILLLNATDLNALTYEWQDGSSNSTFQVAEAGIYAVTLTDECNVVTDEVVVGFTNCTLCNVYVPNAFSPDFDGYNDNFRPYSNCALQNYSLKVFNRWGALVFESADPDTGWNGTFNNKTIAEGVYVYLLEFEVNEFGVNIKKKLSGDLSVVK
ncbi:MAG: gliding motility-associated C-terminal domain-containing protein [Bacteroidota bacterium]